MLQIILDFFLCWACAIIVHEAAHAIVIRQVGMTVEGINLFCRAGAKPKAGIFAGRILYERGGICLGLDLLCGGCVKFSFDSDTLTLSRVAVDLAGPAANILLAVYFGLRGETMAVLVNLFCLSTAYNDVSSAVKLCVSDARRLFSCTAVAYALAALPMVAMSVYLSGWYYALVVFATLSYTGALLVEKPTHKAALATASA